MTSPGLLIPAAPAASSIAGCTPNVSMSAVNSSSRRSSRRSTPAAECRDLITSQRLPNSIDPTFAWNTGDVSCHDGSRRAARSCRGTAAVSAGYTRPRAYCSIAPRQSPGERECEPAVRRTAQLDSHFDAWLRREQAGENQVTDFHGRAAGDLFVGRADQFDDPGAWH